MKPMTSTPAPLRVVRRIAPLVAVAALAVGGWFGYQRWHDSPAALTYTTAAAQRGTVRQTVTASGTLSPVVQSTVGSQVSGRLTEVLVDFNDHVEKGQVLARLDPSVLKGQVAQARARLASARAELVRAKVTAASAQLTYDRNASLIATGAIAAADVDTAKAALDTARASIDAAKAAIVESSASLDAAVANLGYTTITAPIDGVIVSRSVDAGQTVAASLQAPELFVIAGDLAKMELHAAVAEADVGQLRDGLAVELAFDAYPDRTFAGTVRQVRNQATTTSNVVTYDAVVAVDNADGALRPGMTATATFVVASSSDGFVVAAKALKYRPAGARPPARDRAPTADQPRGPRTAIWVMRAGQPVRVAVSAGLSDGTSTLVTSPDLHEGDLVITADSRRPAAGAPSGNPGGNRGGNGNRRAGPPPLL